MEILKKTSARELRAMVKKSVSPLLSQLGFIRNGNGYMREYRDGVLGYIGFNTFCGVDNELCYVMFIGLSQKEVSALIMQLHDRTVPSKPLCPTWKGITDIIPNTRYSDYVWKVKNPSDIEQLCNTMLQTLRQWILPFFEKNCCKEMYEYLMVSGGWPDIAMRDKITPILYYLNGEKYKGEEYIKTRLESKPEEAFCDIFDKVFLKNYHELE